MRRRFSRVGALVMLDKIPGFGYTYVIKAAGGRAGQPVCPEKGRGDGMMSLAEWEKGAEEKSLLERCRNLIREAEENATVILYGSRARGDEAPESDYDLLVLVDGPVSFDRERRIRHQIFEVELETGSVVSVNTYSYQDWESSLYRAIPFRRNVEADGVAV